MGKMNKLHLFLVMVFVVLSAGCRTEISMEAPSKRIRVELPDKPNSQLVKIVSVFTRQVEKRCPAKVTTQGEAPLTVALKVDPGHRKGRVPDQ